MDKAIFGLFSDVENNPITTSLGYEAVFLSIYKKWILTKFLQTNCEK